MSLTLKRHYKLLVMLVLFSAVLIVGAGDQPIIAYTIQGTGQMAELSIGGTVATLSGYSDNLAQFEDAVAHNIQSLLSGVDY